MNTKPLSFISAIVVAVALFTACADDNTAIGFGQVNVERKTSLVSGTDSPQCNVTMSVDEAHSGNANIDKDINETVEKELFGMSGLSLKAAADSFANQYVRDYRESLTKLYQADRTDKNKRAWYEYKYTVTTNVEKGRKGVTVYKADIEYYEGGAHGVSLRAIFNFDNATGRKITLADIFVPGSDKRLTETLLQALKDKTGKKDIEDLKAEGYLCVTDIYAPQNFILGTDAITFVYNAYEIAPYEKGSVTLDIDYDNLEDIMRKQ